VVIKLLYSAMYATYGAKNYKYTKDTVEAIKKHYDGLEDKSLLRRRDYDKFLGVFPCRTFNLGQQSVSVPHTDHNNLAQGWCSITPLGNFDSVAGGHLVLWDLGLIVQFPPGTTALIPSSLILHFNTPIQPGEVRYSIVQYASGHLFRWVKNGFCTNTDLKKQATKEELEQWKRENDGRWKSAVDSFTTLEELHKTEELVRAAQVASKGKKRV